MFQCFRSYGVRGTRTRGSTGSVQGRLTGGARVKKVKSSVANFAGRATISGSNFQGAARDDVRLSQPTENTVI